MIEGAPNFRDLGGIPAGEGRVVASGRVYRSEGLNALTDDGSRALGGLGIQLVCDLRTEGERAQEVSRWPADGEPELLHTGAGTLSDADLRVLREERLRPMLTDSSGELAREYMLKTYRRMPEAYAEVFATLARRIADDGQLPIVVHCAAGKDRTGFVCSLLLLTLGADRSVVHDEYLRSDDHFGRERLHELLQVRSGIEPAQAAVDGFRSHPDLLDAALDAAAGEHGTIDAYIEHRCGVDNARRERLREALLVAA